MNTDSLIHRELSESIIGAAMKVLNTLKPGLDEKAYENALVIELGKRAHRVDQQKRYNVLYDGIVVDTLVPDLGSTISSLWIRRWWKISPPHTSRR